MSTSDETQQGKTGARTATTSRTDAGSDAEPADAAAESPPTDAGAAAAAAKQPASGAGSHGTSGTSGTSSKAGTTRRPASQGTGRGATTGAAPATGAGSKAPPRSAPTAPTAPAAAGKTGAKPAPGTAAAGAGAGAAAATATVAGRPVAPRRVRLTVARVDPWSVMKLSFLLSVALGIAFVVASGVLWSILDGMGVYTDVSRVVGEIIGDSSFDLTVFAGFGRTLSLVTVLAVVNVVLLTAIFTLGAFLYNISAALVGGLHVTLSDD